MVAVSDTTVEGAALARRKALTGASGPMALVKNFKVFAIACFACLGGWVDVPTLAPRRQILVHS